MKITTHSLEACSKNGVTRRRLVLNVIAIYATSFLARTITISMVPRSKYVWILDAKDKDIYD